MLVYVQEWECTIASSVVVSGGQRVLAKVCFSSAGQWFQHGLNSVLKVVVLRLHTHLQESKLGHTRCGAVGVKVRSPWDHVEAVSKSIVKSPSPAKIKYPFLRILCTTIVSHETVFLLLQPTLH